MLKTLRIKNFRLFQDLTLDSLNKVNLIAGENNAGKTAVLEALCLLLGDSKRFVAFASTFRSNQGSDDFDSFWMWLSSQRKQRKLIEIEVRNEEDAPYIVRQNEQTLRDSTTVLTFDYFKNGHHQLTQSVSKDRGFDARNFARSDWPQLRVFSAFPTSPIEDAEYFNRIAAKRGGEQRVVELLQVIEPRLQDLKYLKLGSQPLVYADLGMEDLIPTTQLGQGFTRLLRWFSEILLAKSEIVVIDEIENGIHYSAMPKVWKGIATIARQGDLQFFATTHSYECIRYAHEAFSSEPTYDLALHRLERDNTGNVRAVSFDRESLDTSLKLEWEIR